MIRRATDRDIFDVYALARSAAVRARNADTGYIVAANSKDGYGFKFQASHDQGNGQPYASVSRGMSVLISAENILYSLAGTNLVDFTKNDVDAYLERSK